MRFEVEVRGRCGRFVSDVARKQKGKSPGTQDRLPRAMFLGHC
jgi:hypothetical protein